MQLTRPLIILDIPSLKSEVVKMWFVDPVCEHFGYVYATIKNLQWACASWNRLAGLRLRQCLSAVWAKAGA